MRFSNPHALGQKRSFRDILLWKAGKYFDFSIKSSPPKNFAYPQNREPFHIGHPYAVWVNHSTFLIHVQGVSFLTDPIWNNTCSPIGIIGKRKHLPPFPIEHLPNIDFVLISHNHYDHLDLFTIKKLARQFPKICWVVPLGLKKWLARKGIYHVEELGWWKHFQKGIVRIDAVPAQHFSGRWGFDYNKTLWCGFVITIGKKKIYFSGDTAYNMVDFAKIGETFRGFDLSLIPIGSYEPRRFMKPIHISPEDAVKIHKEVRSRKSIGMHWKTFRLSDEHMNQPPYDLFLAMKRASLDLSSFFVLEPGEYVNW
ncbi:MAG: MBL fold metallo-hydrolase [Parachlamydiales bacterium]|nr:MBL fold metallo-hydrolase [Parachlamydiales bacterium]